MATRSTSFDKLHRSSAHDKRAPIALSSVLVLLISLLCTVLVSSYLSTATRSNDLYHFQNVTDEALEIIDDHMGAFITLLRGTTAMFAANQNVTASQFRAYVQRAVLKPQLYRGVKGIGYAQRILPSQKSELIAFMREQGNTNFTIFPEGERDELFPIIYLEPLDRRNKQAIGYDMFSEPFRHAAMTLARTNGIAASHKITLVQEIEAPIQAGFLIYVGVYREGNMPDSVDARKRDLVGFVYSPFRADDLVSSIFPHERDLLIHLDIYDGDRVTPEALLHGSANSCSAHPMFSSTNQMQVAGRTWTIVTRTTPRFERTLATNIVPTVVVVGTVVSLLLFGITTFLVEAREKARRSERELRASEELYRALTESAADAIIVIDSNSTIRSVNHSAARIFGYDKYELLGQSLTVLMPERMREHHREGLIRYMTSHRRNLNWESVELPGLHRDGHEIPLEISFGEMVKEESHYFVGIMRDITERKRTREALQASEEKYRTLSSELEQRVQARTSELLAVNKELESFTYSVAHDLRAPARHIHGFVEVLLEDLPAKKPQEVENYLRRIADRARFMGHLVDDLLHLATIGRQELLIEPVPLRNVVDEVIRSMQTETVGRQVEWQIGELPTRNCDRILIRQLFSNLLSNALKYTRSRTVAVIEISEIDLNAIRTIFVRDNGIGFNMAYVGKLFHIFERLHSTAEFEGTGIGLATSLRIVQRHKGKIWAEAEEGKGATFYFTLSEP